MDVAAWLTVCIRSSGALSYVRCMAGVRLWTDERRLDRRAGQDGVGVCPALQVDQADGHVEFPGQILKGGHETAMRVNGVALPGGDLGGLGWIRQLVANVPHLGEQGNIISAPACRAWMQNCTPFAWLACWS